MHLNFGIQVKATAKSAEQVAESAGADIAQRQQHQIDRALQLNLPIVVAEPAPVLTVQLDGTGMLVVKKKTEKLNRLRRPCSLGYPVWSPQRLV